MDFLGVFLAFLVLIGGLILAIFASKIGRFMHDERVEQAKVRLETGESKIVRVILGGDPKWIMKISPKFYIWLCRSLGVFFLVISGLMIYSQYISG